MFTAALLLLAAGLFLVGSALPEGGPPVAGGNAPVDASATDRTDLSAHNSPVAVRDPRQPLTLVVAARVDRPNFSCSVHLSGDGGAKWTDGALPFPAGEESPPRCFAPDLAFGSDGVLYASFVTLIGAGNTPNALWVTSSSDGGQTFTTPVRVSGPLSFQARIATDPAEPGVVYLTWLQATAVGFYQFSSDVNPIVVSRSGDGGRTWSAPVPASAAARKQVIAPSIAVGPRGVLDVLYLDLGSDPLDYYGAHEGKAGAPDAGPWSLVLARSGDGGRTWAESVVDSHVVPTERFLVFTPETPSLAVDGPGHVYVAFTDGRAGDRDVWVWASSDSGVTFGPGRRANDTPLHDGTSQYLPRLAVAPDGRLDVAYYDRRADPKDELNEVSIQSSFDHGTTFTARTRVTDRQFDSRIGPSPMQGMVDLGSRIALVSDDHHALAVWTDTRAGSTVIGKQDLTEAVVDFPTRSPARAALTRTASGAAVLAAAGLLVVVARALRRKPRDHEELQKGAAASVIPQESMRP